MTEEQKPSPWDKKPAKKKWKWWHWVIGILLLLAFCDSDSNDKDEEYFTPQNCYMFGEKQMCFVDPLPKDKYCYLMQDDQVKCFDQPRN